MKRIYIIALIIGITAGTLLALFVLKDGQISIPEAIACFAYLAAVRVIGMLATRKVRKTAEGNEPIRPAEASHAIRLSHVKASHKKAA